MTTRPPADDWTPPSWQRRPAVQQPSYRDESDLGRVLAELAQLPPIVVSWEIESLKRQVADAQQGKRFLLQGGDCAETFAECESGVIARKLKILLQMSLIMLLRGYERAALTLNFVRALVDGGFADLHHPEYWDLGFMHHSPWRDQYQRLVDSISDSLDFFEAMSGSLVHEASRAPFYASHEALHLSYEQAQTRYIGRQQRWYNLSTHMPWIGMRTADPAGAHVEYCRGIANPIGVKVGPDMTGDWLRGLCHVLNPRAEPGRLVLIHRLGAGRIAAELPRLIDAVRSDCGPILWVCDPMHGNTETTAGGLKTRRFDNIVQELEAAFRLHSEHGSRLGGVHFELTGEDVTECIGGARGLEERDLSRAYRSQVDPRLNYEQALELAMRIAGHARAV
jgi:3-deoxy-7-phosphoheptulonate synthase